MVEIHLCNHPGSQIPFLTVPLSDIQRLAIRPLKWLRFVMFAICGARGHLSTTPDGVPVNYDASFDDLAGPYYYQPDGQIALVDYYALDGEITSSGITTRRGNLRADIVRRDGQCIVIQTPAEDCDAAHLIPHCKGVEYIQRVIFLRSSLYSPSDSLPANAGINATENGILLGKTLHSMFGRGDFAFIKTPNFALDPDDIPRVTRGPADMQQMPASRVTLQYLKPRAGFDLARNSDSLNAFQTMLASGIWHPPDVISSYIHSLSFGLDAVVAEPRHSPPAILLDYIYGVSAYKVWKTPQSKELMEKFFEKHYKSIPIPPPESRSDEDSNYKPSDDEPHTPAQPREGSPRASHEMVHAIDELNAVLMYVTGTTPQMLAEQAKRWEEEEQAKVQKASEMKVMEWLDYAIHPQLEGDDHIAIDASAL